MMKEVLFFALISALILFQPFCIYAQTVEPTKTPTLTPTPSTSADPTLSLTPTPTIILTTEPLETLTITPTATLDMISTVPSPTVTLTPTTTPTLLEIPKMPENEYKTDINNEVKIELDTGSNTADDVTTNGATASANLDNQLNLNQIGTWNWVQILNKFSTEDNDIDLSAIQGHLTNPELLSALEQNEYTEDGVINQKLADLIQLLMNSNNASIHNLVDISVNTGNNESTPEAGVVTTGDADVNLNISNIANTNVVGDNTFYSVINLFNDQSGDIILPYELDFVPVQGVNNLYTNNPENHLQNKNNSETENNIAVNTNTGKNEGSEITTGDNAIKISVIDKSNITITDSNFLLLDVNNYGEWTGTVDGWWGDQQKTADGLRLWYKLPDNDRTEIVANGDMKQTNLSEVKNDITIKTNTGDNTAETINTGNSLVKANVFNMVNTSIIGNNWFYGMVNIFDTFSGNIIFSRPDLQLSGQSSKNTVLPSEEFEYFLNFENIGTTFDDNVAVSIDIPDYLEFISASDGGTFANGKIGWKLGKINPKQRGDVSLKLKLKDRLTDKQFRLNSRITTRRIDPNLTNNSLTTLIFIGEPLPTKSINNVSVQPTTVTQQSDTFSQVLINQPATISVSSPDIQGITTSFAGLYCPSSFQPTAHKERKFTLTSFNLPLTFLAGLFFLIYRSIFKTNTLINKQRGGGN